MSRENGHPKYLKTDTFVRMTGAFAVMAVLFAGIAGRWYLQEGCGVALFMKQPKEQTGNFLNGRCGIYKIILIFCSASPGCPLEDLPDRRESVFFFRDASAAVEGD